MIRPNYSPKEALEKMKLLMGYDSSKTLKENEEKILKEDGVDVAKGVGGTAAIVGGGLGGAAAASGLGAIGSSAMAGAVGGPIGMAIGAGVGVILTILGMNAWMSGSDDEEKKIKEFCAACDKTDPKAKVYTSRMALSNIEQAQLAKQLAKSFEYQSLGFMGGTDDSVETGWRGVTKVLEERGQFGDVCAMREMYGKSTFENRVIGELEDDEQAEFAGALGVVLQRSIKGNIKIKHAEAAGSNWWLESFPCLEVTDSFAPDWTPKVDKYGNSFVDVNFKIKGTLKTFHLGEDGKIYVPTGGGDPNAHKFSGKMIQCATPTKPKLVVAENKIISKKSIKEQAEFDIDITPIDVDLDPDNKNPVPTVTSTGNKTPTVTPVVKTDTYKTCPDTFPIEKFCVNDTIKKVQGCLGGLSQDGKFGPKTQSALEDKGLLGSKITQFTLDTVCKETKTKSPDDGLTDTISGSQGSVPNDQGTPAQTKQNGPVEEL
jgi:hypothetical protein